LLIKGGEADHYAIQACGIELASHLTEETGLSATWTKRFEFQFTKRIVESSTLRLVVDIKGSQMGNMSVKLVYNGTDLTGGPNVSSGTSYATITEDYQLAEDITAGTYLEVWTKAYTGATMDIKNLYIKGLLLMGTDTGCSEV